MTKAQFVKALRGEKYWLVGAQGSNTILLMRTVADRAVTVKLERKALKWKLLFPSYLFSSSISHFAPVEQEIRLTRNKGIISSLIKMLRRSVVWKVIENKEEFVQINPSYKGKRPKMELRKELSLLLGK